MPVNLLATPAAELFPVPGVRWGIAEAGIRKAGRKDLSVLLLDEGSVVGGVFTQNRFCAAPVQICREHLALHGGLTQGAGQVFGEHAVYDADSGQLLTGSFMDYAMPKAVLVKNLTLLEHPVPTAANPLGAKGVGEAGVTGSLPALMSAVADALRGVGVTRFDMPATPNRLWLAIQAAKAGDPRAMAVPDLPTAD